MTDENIELLKNGLATLNIDASKADTLAKYADILIETNAKFNLLGKVDEKDIVIKHILDSAAGVKFIKDARTVLDIGTGAGFPGFVLAVCCPDKKFTLADATEKRDYMVAELEKIGGVEFNSPKDALPFVTNISVMGIKSEPLLNYLSAKGVCVSSGSACSKGKKSRVLTEMGLSHERMESPIRISFSRYTTKEEIDYLTDCIKSAKNDIRAIK